MQPGLVQGPRVFRGGSCRVSKIRVDLPSGHKEPTEGFQAEERKGHSGQEGQAVQGNRDGWKVAGTQAVVLWA